MPLLASHPIAFPAEVTLDGEPLEVLVTARIFPAADNEDDALAEIETVIRADGKQPADVLAAIRLRDDKASALLNAIDAAVDAGVISRALTRSRMHAFLHMEVIEDGLLEQALEAARAARLVS